MELLTFYVEISCVAAFLPPNVKLLSFSITMYLDDLLS